MKGTVRTKEKCPKCSGPFQVVKHPLTKDVIDLMCPTCKTRPLRYYLDCRDMKAGRLYTDRHGQPFDSFVAAHRQLETMRKQFDDHTFDSKDWVPKDAREYNLSVAAEKWLDKVDGQKSHSYARHARTEFIRHIIPRLGNMDVRDLRYSHIEDLRDDLLEKGLAPKTVKNVLGTLQTFMRRLYLRGDIPREPHFPPVLVPDSARGWINREKQGKILALIPERHKLIFKTLMETAERPGEVCAHKKKDLIDGEICIERAFDERGVIKHTKSGRARYSGVSLELWNKLYEHAKDKLPEAWLFIDEKGFPYTQRKLYRIWKRASKEAGVDISLYPGTRHSRASQKRLEKEHEIAQAVRDELGHTSNVALGRYAQDRKQER